MLIISFVMLFLCGVCSRCLPIEDIRADWDLFQKLFSHQFEFALYPTGVISDDNLNYFELCDRVMTKILETNLTYVDNSTHSGEHSIRILYMVDAATFITRKERHVQYMYFALRDQQDFDVTLWGKGFPGYNSSDTMLNNILLWFENPTFDVIHVIPACNADLNSKFLPGNPIVVSVIHEADMRLLNCLHNLNALNHLVFTPYAHHLGVMEEGHLLDASGKVRYSESCPLNPFYQKFLFEEINNSTLLPTTAEYKMAAFCPHAISSTLYSSPLSLYASEILSNRSLHKFDFNALLFGAQNVFIYPERAKGTQHVLNILCV